MTSLTEEELFREKIGQLEESLKERESGYIYFVYNYGSQYLVTTFIIQVHEIIVCIYSYNLILCFRVANGKKTFYAKVSRDSIFT